MTKYLYAEDYSKKIKDKTANRNENKVKQAVRDIAAVLPKDSRISDLQIARIISGYVSPQAVSLGLSSVNFDSNPGDSIAVSLGGQEGIIQGFEDCSCFTPAEVLALVKEVLPEFDDRIPDIEEEE